MYMPTNFNCEDHKHHFRIGLRSCDIGKMKEDSSWHEVQRNYFWKSIVSFILFVLVRPRFSENDIYVHCLQLTLLW